MAKLSDLQVAALRAAERGEHPAHAVERAAKMVGRNDCQRTASRTANQLVTRGLLKRWPDYWTFAITDAGREALEAAGRAGCPRLEAKPRRELGCRRCGKPVDDDCRSGTCRPK